MGVTSAHPRRDTAIQAKRFFDPHVQFVAALRAVDPAVADAYIAMVVDASAAGKETA